jgi:hypothetical protein
MKAAVVFTVIAVLSGSLAAQETKPVPKDSVRVSIPGCVKGHVFTVGRRTPDQPGSADIREGMHLRMNGPKKLMAEIKGQEGSMIEITGIMKRGQQNPDGVAVGGGVRIGPGSPSGGSRPGLAMSSQPPIDVEGWRPAVGYCPSH